MIPQTAILNMAIDSHNNAVKDIRKLSGYSVDRRITSQQSPYKIIDIAHVAVNPEVPTAKGRLSISIAPGKKDNRWNRDLMLDLDAIRMDGIQIIVCLLEWGEMMMLNVGDYPMKAQEQGFLFYHIPVKDRCAPNQKEINSLVPVLVQHLVAGQNILIHCRGGLGRAGTLCACCLAHFGYNSQVAMETVRARRRGAIQTRKQEECITQYCYGLLK